MTELVEQTLSELAQTVSSGAASCREIVRAVLDRIDAIDERVGAFV